MSYLSACVFSATILYCHHKKRVLFDDATLILTTMLLRFLECPVPYYVHESCLQGMG